MFPEPGEAINRTIEAEAALTDLYSEALNQWVAATAAFVVPDLAGVMVNGDPSLVAATIPPDPDGVAETSGVWDQLSEELILAGLATIYALSVYEAMNALGVDLPSARRGASQDSPAQPVIDAIVRTTQATEAEITVAHRLVADDPHMSQASADLIDSQREIVAAAPGMMRDKIEEAVRAVPTGVDRVEHPTGDVSVIVTERKREAATQVMTPGSVAVRDVARYQGYQAAGIQNAAVVDAARFSEDAPELDKVWIATIDSRTRPTHFAADGQRAPLAGSFTVGGTHLAYPADPTGPAAEVRNCRCRVGILAKDEELPSDVDRHTERLNGRDATARNRAGSQADEISRRAERGTVRARDDEDGIGRTAAGTPSEEHDMTVKNTEQGGTTAVLANDGEDEAAPVGETFRTFTDCVLALLGESTSDDRMIATDAELSFRTFPLPLMWMQQTGSGFGGHTEAFTVGAIESAKVEGNKIVGSGYLLNTPEADLAANEVAHQVTGPSVDLASTQWKLVDEDGKEISEEEWWDLPIDAKVLQCITAAELIGTTLVAKPAFGDTSISLNAERESRDIAVVASAAEEFRPRTYPTSMFSDPQLSGPTLPTMDDTGRIYGHIACFGACHRSIQSKCVMAPRTKTDYAHFHTSPAVRLDDGSRIPVGRLTVGTGHAPDAYSGAPAKAHYDNTGTCFALVRVGEDAHGIWFSGVAHPQATPEQVEMGLTAPLSGDWRDFGQGLELIAALAVNTPGFAARGRDDEQGRPVALVASLGPAPQHSNAGAPLTAESIADIVERAVHQAYAKRETDAEVASLIAMANDKVGPPPPPKTPAEETADLLARAASL